MSISEEIAKLAELQQRGLLSDDEFARAKARVIDDPGRARPAPPVAAVNALRRSRGDRWLGGVCGGLARLTGIEAWLWRLAFVALLLCAGTGVLVYALLWLFVPDEPVPPVGGHGQPVPG